MKKIGVLFCLFTILTSFIFLSSVQSQSLETTADKFTETIDKNVNTLDKLTDEQQRTQYLKQEWTKMLEGDKFGKILLGINAFFKELSPVFKIIIGVEYSLSWIFILSLILWIAVFFILYEPLKEIFHDNPIIAIIISFSVSLLSSQGGNLPKAIEFFSPLFTNDWIIIISVLVTILILSLYAKFLKKFGKGLREVIKKEKEEQKEIKETALGKIKDTTLKAHGYKAK